MRASSQWSTATVYKAQISTNIVVGLMIYFPTQNNGYLGFPFQAKMNHLYGYLVQHSHFIPFRLDETRNEEHKNMLHRVFYKSM